MKTSFGYGLDNISSFFIKLALPFLARPLAYLLNFSLQSGIFPDSWKTARAAPVYKEGSKEERSNYRPISVLPFLARLFENLVNKKVYDYLNKNELIYRQQSGIRSLHSVVVCLISNTNDWYFHLDQGMCTGIVFVDMKKALTRLTMISYSENSATMELRIMSTNGSRPIWGIGGSAVE